MKGKNSVTEEDIQKAYEALGLEIEPADDVQKGGDGCAADGGDQKTLKKAKSKKASDADDDDAGSEAEDDTEGGDDEGEVEESKKGNMKKGGEGNRFDRIEKAIATSHQINSKYIKALGVMIKDASQKLEAAAQRENELLDIVKGYEDTISDLSEKLERFGSEVPAPKSISAARPVERQFAKGDEEDDLNKGGDGRKDNRVSMSKQPAVVSEILDQATFSKGYDAEFSKACTTFEASKTLPASIIARVKNEFGIEIVK